MKDGQEDLVERRHPRWRGCAVGHGARELELYVIGPDPLLREDHCHQFSVRDLLCDALIDRLGGLSEEDSHQVAKECTDEALDKVHAALRASEVLGAKIDSVLADLKCFKEDANQLVRLEDVASYIERALAGTAYWLQDHRAAVALLTSVTTSTSQALPFTPAEQCELATCPDTLQ